jgi:hypothetical protein
VGTAVKADAGIVLMGMIRGQIPSGKKGAEKTILLSGGKREVGRGKNGQRITDHG